ncbi:ORF67 [White spot syndrome virus]|uniref:Wsv106 n=6 Tax=White spot syndrome virus TaxID=342409 RepID=Q77J81_WSSVS|nr:wsv106 [Shrimp white spot syndrome virus]YP_009220505.1 hypothetical protein SWSSV_gp031 [White spot syndrome virus]AAK77736.1 ORF67 [White spot syndrome virus]AAL33110.1 wsv106 [Shrimp white spot syndrome virus]AAL89030.1 WSSV162 [Shrimp white spot syndrome virus]ALN66157.1 hypothetical protein [White spot syndrome virus]ALN66319.1 hypothetical protein [White spot syndrome virus]
MISLIFFLSRPEALTRVQPDIWRGNSPVMISLIFFLSRPEALTRVQPDIWRGNSPVMISPSHPFPPFLGSGVFTCV